MLYLVRGKLYLLALVSRRKSRREILVDKKKKPLKLKVAIESGGKRRLDVVELHSYPERRMHFDLVRRESLFVVKQALLRNKACASLLHYGPR